MMVSMAAALFVQVGMGATDASSADLTRVIQGIAAGIGFIGAGTILKLTDRLEIRGITTASSIWLAAAVGSACGIRHFLLAAVAALFSIVILYAVGKLEAHFPPRRKDDDARYHDETQNSNRSS